MDLFHYAILTSREELHRHLTEKTSAGESSLVKMWSGKNAIAESFCHFGTFVYCFSSFISFCDKLNGLELGRCGSNVFKFFKSNSQNLFISCVNRNKLQDATFVQPPTSCSVCGVIKFLYFRFTMGMASPGKSDPILIKV